jgi:hypothetical protein
MSWKAFLRAHWEAIAGADFFAVEVLTLHRLNHVVLLGEQHLRTVVREYVAHYHTERNHQGVGNALVAPLPAVAKGVVQRGTRLGGLLSYYHQEAA